ncbi:MAG: Hsp33 family molecular chaperone HslO [Clostridia bacterium]|nr:Hsp33 family molecular chaperone HslO [Clostridia bacterium]
MPSMITRAITADGSARIIFTDSTAIVAKAREIHNTSKTMTAVLGRSLTAASLMGSLLKDKGNTLTFQIKADGPAGAIVCVSDYKGNVRGYVDNPDVELPANPYGKLDVGGAVGIDGRLVIIKDMGMAEPYVGMCPLVTGEIGDDVSSYFATSEQTPTVCALGVRVNPDLTIKSAGGFLLQLLPGADEAVAEKIEENIAKISSVSQMIADGMTAEEIIAVALEGFEYQMFDEFDTDYVCPCSREKYLTALAGLSQKDIDELEAEGEPIETVCHFCDKRFVFDIQEVLVKRAQK